MKPQDILFVLLLAFLLWKRDSRLLVGVGLVLLFLSIPLFAKWIFFTAERFVWYAAAFFFFAILLELISLRHDK